MQAQDPQGRRGWRLDSRYRIDEVQEGASRRVRHARHRDSHLRRVLERSTVSAQTANVTRQQEAGIWRQHLPPSPVDGEWVQADSHHSYEGGSPNLNNIEHDTQTDRVLISDDFSYFGGEGPPLPARFRGAAVDIRKKGPGHKSIFPREVIDDFVDWIRGLHHVGYAGEPLDWFRKP